MQLVDSIDALYNLIGFVRLTAPDRFPVRDFLPPDQQWTLERAFAELHRGLQYVDPQVADENKLKRLRELLDASLQAYKRADRAAGIERLFEFESLIFKNQ